jgi:hypothetical protein
MWYTAAVLKPLSLTTYANVHMKCLGGLCGLVVRVPGNTLEGGGCKARPARKDDLTAISESIVISETHVTPRPVSGMALAFTFKTDK